MIYLLENESQTLKINIFSNLLTLIHFIYPKDNDFSFRLFKGQELISEYLIDHTDGEPIIDVSKLNSSKFVLLTEIGLSATELETLLCQEAMEEYFSLPDRFMELLGIEPISYSWISYHYCRLLETEDPERFVKI